MGWWNVNTIRRSDRFKSGGERVYIPNNYMYLFIIWERSKVNKVVAGLRVLKCLHIIYKSIASVTRGGIKSDRRRQGCAMRKLSCQSVWIVLVCSKITWRAGAWWKRWERLQCWERRWCACRLAAWYVENRHVSYAIPPCGLVVIVASCILERIWTNVCILSMSAGCYSYWSMKLLTDRYVYCLLQS